MFVLDTDTLIFFFKGLHGVPNKLLATPPGDIGIPTIVLYELEVGIAKSQAPRKRRAQLDDLLRLTQQLAFGRAEASASARIRATLERNGTPIGPMDTLIAGTALAAGATLITRNTREFSRVPGLKVVNWCDDALNGG
jgi:tRNA(fMet)-specific endonuclease VapC